MGPAPQPIVGTVQHYDWGDIDFLPRLLGTESDGRPCAELWLGTHPNGPSKFVDGTPLSDATGTLPYLLKVLCAADPLSLQAHPNTTQAIDGHARGVYPDASAKPELLVALTRFEAFCGVRPPRATIALLRSLGAMRLADVVAADGPGAAMRGLYLGDIDPYSTLDACAGKSAPEAQWVEQLNTRYPGDPSVAVTLLLNYVVLSPGEALHLTAGNLHGYLRGSGIELMQASDNVVRGGLTMKPVDLVELLKIVDPTPLVQPVMVDAVLERRYRLPEAGVELVRLGPGDTHTAVGHELTISVNGNPTYLAPGTTFTAAVETYVVAPL